MRIRLYKKLIINGFDISKVKDSDTIKDNKMLLLAYHLFLNNCYPISLREQIEEKFSKQNIEMEISNHNRFKKDKVENPQWFN